MTDSKIDRKQYNKPMGTQELILNSLYEHGPLGTGKIAYYTNLDRETIRFNCRKLVKQGWIYDREKSQKGKYRLVEQSKIPVFLSFRTRNRSLKTKILHDIFSDNNNSLKSLDDFSKKIGIYISYILLEATRPSGPWTSKGFKTNDPRMKNIDLLRETWLSDTIEHNCLSEQFVRYFSSNSNNQNYKELTQMFESSFPNIYRKIVFHEGIAEVRSLKKKQNSNKKKQTKLQPKLNDEEHWEEISDEFVEQSQKWIESISKTKQNYDKINNP